MKMLGYCVYVEYLLLIAHISNVQAEVPECFGMKCFNEGVLELNDTGCYCRCQEHFSGIVCEYELLQSSWPSGPYAIPKPVGGCPESISQGWVSGYINLTTSISMDLTVVTDNKTSLSIDISRPFPNKPLAQGPFGKYTIQFNFCFKTTIDHAFNAITEWPQGKYSIYCCNNSCPFGFEKETTAIPLPPMLYWNSDGYLPEYEIEDTENGAVLHLNVCRSLADSSDTVTPPSWNNSFILLKDKVENCTVLVGFYQTEQAVTLSWGEGNHNTSRLFHYCHFMPISMQYGQITTMSQMDLLVENLSFREGKTIDVESVTFQKAYRDWFKDSNIVDIEHPNTRAYSGIKLAEMFQAEGMPWIVFDFGRRAEFLYFFVVLDFIYGKFNATESENLPDIYISDDKWSFLHHGAEICRFNTDTEYEISSIVIHKLLRSKHGRYASIVGTNYQENVHIVEYFLRILYVLFIANPTRAAKERVCNRELGMTDGVIEEFQVTATSSESGYYPNMARRFSSGWCAAETSQSPFLQIDLLSPTTVEGITVFNWHELHDYRQQNMYVQDSVPMGSSSFQLSYGTSLDKMHLYSRQSFRLDLSRPFLEPQTILFMKPFLSRFVRIYPRPLLDRTCLKVELFGCRKAVIPSLQCNNVTANRLINLTRAFVSPLYVMPKNGSGVETWQDCMDECIHRQNECSTIDYKLGYMCRLFMESETQNYQIMTTDETQHILSSRICWTDVYEFLPPTQTFAEEKTWLNSVVINKFDVEGIITSFGYPFHYDTSQVYTWLIKFSQDDAFIRLVFSNISLNVFDGITDHCHEHIGITEHKFMTTDPSADNFIRINNNYNGLTPTFATGWSKLYLTFVTRDCDAKRVVTGHGFRAILKKDDLANCFTLKSSRYFICDEPSMFLASDGFNGLPTVHDDNFWVIRGKTFIPIVLSITDFDVRCESGMLDIYLEPSFEPNPSEYCNKNIPIGEIRSRHGWMKLHLRRIKQSSELFGFSAFYKIVSNNEIFAHLTSNFTVYNGVPSDILSTVCSENIGKCYDVYASPIENFNWTSASYQCNSYRKRLVAIHSKMEMQFLKQLLQETVFPNYDMSYDSIQMFLSTLKPQPLFHAYIGLRRHTSKSGLVREIWEDESPLTFTAWDENQPSNVLIHQCTSMRFDEVNKNNSWITERCLEPGTASYYICEQQISANDFHSSETSRNDIQFTLTPPWDKSLVYRCDSGEWISVLMVCDSIPDCDDRSDEINCTNSISMDKCPDDWFRCGDDQCIHLSKVCDHVTDCNDGSDEYCAFSSCTENEFQCSNKQCIPEYMKCDAVADCWDGSDETNCRSCSRSRAFQCSDGTCIPLSLVCDSYTDCEDNSDENVCAQKTMYSCKDWWKAGYRQDGAYTIESDQPDVIVECQFKKTVNVLEVITTYHDIEPKKLIGQGQQCQQQFTLTCNPDLLAVAEYDGIYFGTSYSECSCLLTNISKSRPYVVDAINCNNINFNSAPVGQPDWTAMYNTLKKNTTLATRNIIHPEICQSSYNITDQNRTIACNREKRIIPEAKRCLYTVTGAGFIDGCRSLEHLQDCDQFKCPADYMKCPDSFCLASRFVCDGEKQCVDGEDELNCWCNHTKQETIIVYRDNTDIEVKKSVDKFAKQFVSLSGKVRVVNIRKANVVTNTTNEDKTQYEIHEQLLEASSKRQHDYLLTDLTISNHVTDIFNLTADKTLIYVDIKKDNLDLLSLWEKQIISKSHHLDDNNIFHLKIDSSLAGQAMMIDPLAKETKITRLDILGSIGFKALPSICQDYNHIACSGAYRCAASRVCIPFKQVCDGQRHCLYGDDERLCNFSCPAKCSCSGFNIYCGNVGLEYTDLQAMSYNTRYLDVSHNNVSDAQLKLPLLVVLNMSKCGINAISEETFSGVKNLNVLDLSFNKIQHIYKRTFFLLRYLKTLALQGNYELRSIEAGAFVGLTFIKILTITGSRISQIDKSTFNGLELTNLDLSDNKITTVADFAFRGLSVDTLVLENNDIQDFSRKMFNGMKSVTMIRSPAYKICCVKPADVAEDNCFPHKDEFSSCSDLIRNTMLQSFLWAIGICALLGNCVSIVYRLKFDRKRMRLGYGIFVTNLAIADLFMGLYMLTIAIADAIFRDRYIWMDDFWRNSAWCNMAGVLSTMSSEASVLFMCLITIDRLLVIKFPFGQTRFRTKNAILVSLLSWCVAIFIATFPVGYEKYFQNKFYTRFGVCLALPLTRDRPPGWLYSVLVFIGFNFSTFVLIAIGQWMIYKEVTDSKTRVQKTGCRKKDLKIARNLLFIVSTDFMCWFPIGCMGIMAISGHEIPGEVYAWAAVLILPINSAINPFLYTLSAIINKNKFTPSMDEQSRSDLQKDLGQQMLQLWHSRYFKRKTGDVRSISLQQFVQRTISVSELAKITLQITHCLKFLHAYELIQGRLSMETISVSVSGDDMTLGYIQIDLRHPAVSSSAEDKAKDIYDLGCIIRKLAMRTTS